MGLLGYWLGYPSTLPGYSLQSPLPCPPTRVICMELTDKLGDIPELLRRRQWHPTPVLLAWKIPWTEEPGRLQSMGSLRVRQG